MNVESALRRRRQEIASRRERDALERSLEEQAAELKEAMLSMPRVGARRSACRARTRCGGSRARSSSAARETWQHIERMGELSALLARRLGFDADYVEMIRVAAPMHDVGKVAVPDAVLLKPGPLDPRGAGATCSATR